MDTNINHLKDLPPIIIKPEEVMQLPNHKRVGHVMSSYLKSGDTIAKTSLIKYLAKLLGDVVGGFNMNPVLKAYMALMNTGISIFELTTIFNNVIKVSGDDRVISNALTDVLTKMLEDNYCKNGEDAYTYGMGGNHFSLIREHIFDISEELATEYGIRIIVREKKESDSCLTRVFVGEYSDITFLIYDEKYKSPLIETDYQTSYLMVTSSSPENVDVKRLSIIAQLSNVVNKVFFNKINPTNNYVIIDKAGYNIHSKKQVNEEIRNLPYDEIISSMKYAINNDMKRGYILVGNPGVGKTLVIHKLIGEFTEIPTFIVKNECLMNAEDIKTVFGMVKSFKAILIFDDFDGLDVRNKNYITNEFLHQLDINGEYSGIVLATVNDPSLVNYTLMNRPGRFDEVHLMKLPETVDDVKYVLINKLNNISSDKYSFEHDMDEFYAGCIKNKFTHAKIASCVDYCLSRVDYVNCEGLIKAMNAAITFTENAKLFSNNGELSSKNNGITTDFTNSFNPIPSAVTSLPSGYRSGGNDEPDSDYYGTNSDKPCTGGF